MLFFDNRFKSSFNKKKKSGIHIYKFNCLHCKKRKTKSGECVDGYYGSFGFKFQLKEVKHVHTYSKFMYTHTHSQGHTNSVSISVKLRIKDPVNLARFPCQKQAVCSFAFTGFRRLFFHTLLFPPDNLMSIFFSSGIKTL